MGKRKTQKPAEQQTKELSAEDLSVKDLTYVDIRIPLAPIDKDYATTHIEVKLDDVQKVLLERIFHALRIEDHQLTRPYKKVDRPPDVIRFFLALIEQAQGAALRKDES